MNTRDVEVTINQLFFNAGQKKAVASVRLYGELFISDITVLECKSTMPYRPDKKNKKKRVYIAGPTSDEVRIVIEKAIQDEYERLMLTIDNLEKTGRVEHRFAPVYEKYNEVINRYREYINRITNQKSRICKKSAESMSTSASS